MAYPYSAQNPNCLPREWFYYFPIFLKISHSMKILSIKIETIHVQVHVVEIMQLFIYMFMFIKKNVKFTNFGCTMTSNVHVQ